MKLQFCLKIIETILNVLKYATFQMIIGQISARWRSATSFEPASNQLPSWIA